MKYFISSVVSRCAVPGFFFMAAMFLYRKPFSWKANALKKIKTLLIPFLLLNTFWIFFSLLLKMTSSLPLLSNYFSDPSDSPANWEAFRWFEAYLSNRYITLVPTWFMRDLFVLNLLAVFILKILDAFPKISAAVLVLAWLFVPEELYKSSTWELQAICFFGLGCLFVRKNFKLEIFDRVPALIHWGVYVALVVADLLTRGKFFNLFIHRLGVIYGIIFWYSCATKFKAGGLKNFLLGFSAFNFSIYIFHELMMSCVQKVFARLFPATPTFQLFLYIFVPMIIILYCVTLSVLLKKYFPRVYALVTGDR